MSEQTEHWKTTPQQGEWANCPRYGLMITGCTRQFVCMSGIDNCFSVFPRQDGYKHITHSERIKQIGFSHKQSVRSVKMVGV